MTPSTTTRNLPSRQGIRWRLAVLAAAVGLAVWVGAAPPGAASTPTSASVGSVAVTVGVDHSCALSTSGAVSCWGGNAHGELGDGTRSTRVRPTPVVGLGSGVVQVSARRFTTCAVLGSGAVRCWGSARNGLLGSAATRDSVTPVEIVGFDAPVKNVSVGEVSACAVTRAGAVRCWGSGAEGGLGDGRTRSSRTPVAVVGLSSGVSAVATGLSHACALSGSRLSCWGANRYGQLGTGNRHPRTTPGAVRLSEPVASVSAGRSTTCATTTDGGRVWCWGQNNAGWLGVGSDKRGVGHPAPVVGPSGFTGVEALGLGGFVTCAAGAPQTWCWGNNDDGPLGDGTRTSRTSPVAVTGLPAPTTTVASSDLHTCATSATGDVYCWGFNSTGQLGDGTTTLSPVPVRVAGLGG